MENLKKFRDRLRITIILYTFSKPINNQEGIYGEFKTEIKIQALDFLLRYPDFLSLELIDLMDNDPSINEKDIQNTIYTIYQNNEPEIRVDEMEKFFHGAYESIDDVIAFLVMAGFIKYESKKRSDGKKYERKYYITEECVKKIESYLKEIPVVEWHFERCALIKKYFDKFSGSELKTRQYKYKEYSEVSYKSHIQNINGKVKTVFQKRFNQELA